MDLGVLHNILVPPECSLTDGAAKWFLSRVNPGVFHQGIPQFESSLTDGTTVGFLSCVTPHVTGQADAMTEALAAH